MSALNAGPQFVSELVRVAVFRRSLVEIFGFVVLAAVCLAIAFGMDWVAALFDLPDEIFQENGPIETFQALLIGSAGVLFFFAALRFDFEIFYGSLVLALLSGLAVVREIPGCGTTFYDGGACLSDTAKDLATTAIVAMAIAVLAWRRIPLAKHLRELNLFWIVPAALAGGMLVAGEAMEHLHASGLEETLETAAYLLLLCFAGWIHANPERFDARLQAFE